MIEEDYYEPVDWEKRQKEANEFYQKNGYHMNYTCFRVLKDRNVVPPNCLLINFKKSNKDIIPGTLTSWLK